LALNLTVRAWWAIAREFFNKWESSPRKRCRLRQGWPLETEGASMLRCFIDIELVRRPSFFTVDA